MAEGGSGGGGGVTGSEVIGAAGGVAGLIPALFGRGQNKRVATGFYGQPGYDKNASYYGGSANGLRNYTNSLGVQAGAADARNAFQADYGRANSWERNGVQDRGAQLELAAAQRARALGQVPSIAQMQADREMKQAQAAQGAQQASARGAAGLALAGQVAAGNTANAQSSIAGQAQVNAANERMAAEGAAQNAYTNIRTGDINAQTQAANQAQFQTSMQQANRDANDNRAMGYAQLSGRANEAELGARTQNQATLGGAYNAANVANQQTGNQNAGSKGIIQTLGDFFSSDERAKLPAIIPGLGGRQLRPDEAQPMMGAGSGGAVPSYEVLSNGGEDVAASGKAMSDFATKYVNNPVAQPAMYSDERAKLPLFARGINPRGVAAPPPPVAPRASFDPVRGWTFPAPEAATSSAPTDDGGDDIMRQVDERRAKDAKNAKDPAVGLERISEDRKFIRGGRMPSDDNARTDEEKGLAPGTTDFESTKDKEDPGPGKRPWWTAISAASKSLNDAQFGNRPTMVSDARAKEAAFESGKKEGRAEVVDDVLAPLSGDEPSFVANKSAPVRAAYANFMPPTGKVISAASDIRDAVKSNRPEQQAALDESRRAWFGEGGFEEPNDGGDPVASANRAMAGSAYTYKPGLTPPEQKPGEPNFGPMAQNMEKNPITATVVKTDPTTGLKVLDKDKMLKVTASGLADLQQQQDQTDRKLALLANAGRATKLAFGGRR